MVGLIMGMCRGVVSQQPWRHIHQSYLLSVIAVVAVVALSSTHGHCPAVNSHCNCTGDAHGNNMISCMDLGNISQVPDVRSSNTTYYELRLTGVTTLSTFQAAAFRGSKSRTYTFATIKPGAFSGLGDVLDQLLLNYNKLESLLDDVYNGLNQLKKLCLFA